MGFHKPLGYSTSYEAKLYRHQMLGSNQQLETLFNQAAATRIDDSHMLKPAVPPTLGWIQMQVILHTLP